MGKCLTCGKKGILISDGVGVCDDGLRTGSVEALAVVSEKRHSARSEFDLPRDTPRFADGITCSFCVRECQIEDCITVSD